MIATRRKRVLFVQPSLQPPGGGNGVAAWMIAALAGECDLDLLHWTAVDLDEVNRHYGTDLRAGDFRTLSVNPTLRGLLDLVPQPLALVKMSLLLRRCKQIGARYDCIVTANNEADFGRRGIQYVHYPWLQLPRPRDDLRWYHFGALLKAYYAGCARISDLSFERMRANLTLVNSNWTGANVRRVHGIPTVTLPPPVIADFPPVGWEERENGFVCVGRISHEKEIDKMIDIVAALRASGCDAHLHIIGATGATGPFLRRIRARVREHAWLFLEENLPREEVLHLIARHRYGIHGMLQEHFGMAVMEMVLGGCIPFVPNDGGQVEIIGEAPLLRYDSPADAVDKMARVWGDPNLQQQLRAQLAERRDAVGSHRFVERFREVVRTFDPGLTTEG